MFNSLISDMDKSLARAAFEKDDIKEGIAYYEKYINTLKEQIEQNSDNEKYTVEKNKTVDEFKSILLHAAKNAYGKKEWFLCAKCCQILISYKMNDNAIYKHAGLCFRELKQFDLALDLMKIYTQKEPEDPKSPLYLADAYYDKDKKKYAQKALEYYEKYLETDPKNPTIYNLIGNIYASTIDFYTSNVERQMYYFKKALEYAPNDKIIMKNIQISLVRKGDIEAAKKLYERIYKLHKDNFNHDNYYDYAAFLIRTGNFIKGWNLLDHRFEKETSATYYPEIKKPKWNGNNNISGKTLLVHFEQGFGDVIMFIRFVREMNKYAKNVIAIVQDQLLDLFTESDLGILVLPKSTNLDILKFDYHIPLISLPRVLKLTPETIPQKEGYLKVNPKRIKMFGESFIKTDKFKIGVCFEGAITGKDEQRDIDWKYLKKLSDLPNVQLYCLKKDINEEYFRQIDPEINIICLDENLKSFADTAAAMKNMDLVISTDNVILNLAGALGVRTFGLFNFDREYRWYGVEEGRMIWYDSVKPFQAKAQNEWEELLDRVCEEIKLLN